MQMTPFVSVVMPVRNEASFISGSLGAVLAQDYPRDRMEIIVADGLSDDGTREIIRTAREKNPMVSLVDNPGKIVSTGLNAALRLAKGEIVVRVDGHCEIASDYVSRCVLHLTEDKVDCVGGGHEFEIWRWRFSFSCRRNGRDVCRYGPIPGIPQRNDPTGRPVRRRAGAESG